MFGSNKKAIRDHLPALPQPLDVEDIHALWLKAERFKHPLAPFVTAWLERPRLVGIDDAADRLPVGVAQVNEGKKRGSVRSFSLPSRIEAQADGQQVTLASRDFTLCKHPRLPEEFLAIGRVDGNKGGQAVSVAMRVTIAGLALRPLGMQSGSFKVEARHFLNRVFAGRQGIPRGKRWESHMWLASQMLDRAWIPYRSPVTGKARALRLVLIQDLPSDLDDTITLAITLPDGADKGAPIPPRLHEYAATERRAFYTMLQLAYDWWQPGRTRIPKGKRGLNQWTQLTNAEKSSVLNRYGKYDREGVVDLTAPLTTYKRQRDAFTRGMETMTSLMKRGELQIIEHGHGTGKTWFFLPTRDRMDDDEYRRIE